MTEPSGVKTVEPLKVLDGTAAVALVTLYLTLCGFMSSAGYAFQFGIPVELVARSDFVTVARNLSQAATLLGIPWGLMWLYSVLPTFIVGRLFEPNERISRENWRRVVGSILLAVFLVTVFWVGAMYLFAWGFRRSPELASFVATLLAVVGCVGSVIWLLTLLSPERRALLKQQRVALVSCAAILGPVLSFWQGVDNARSERSFFVDTSDEPTLLIKYSGDSALGYTYRIDGDKTVLMRLRVVSLLGKSLTRVSLDQLPKCCDQEALPRNSALPSDAHDTAGARNPGRVDSPTAAAGVGTESAGGVGGNSLPR